VPKITQMLTYWWSLPFAPFTSYDQKTFFLFKHL